MKTRFLIIIATITIVAIAAIVAGTFSYQQVYDQNCRLDGGKVTGFLKCTYIHTDYGSEDCDEECELERRRIGTGPATNVIESFQEKYDAVVEGTIISCMGHKETYPIRYQCEIQVDSYIKYDGKQTGQLTVIAYRDSLNEDTQNAIFGLDYNKNENYYELVESGFDRK